MVHTDVSDVLVAGAGPVGLTAAAELRRRGVACRIVDRLPARLPFAKAVGIQPRTLEIWDRMGLVRAALDAAVPMRGQLIYVNGAEQARLDLVLPPEVPYGFAALPQYETERILEEFLARFGTRIERGTELLSFTQDADGVTSRLLSSSGTEEEVRSRFLVGCDGAHSVVRKTLGLTFEGGAFPEEYMLADVEVDWDLPPGYGVRAMHHDAEGAVDDVLVCIPLPGPGRYRMSMLVPPELSTARRTEGADQDGVAHGLEGGRAPALPHIQAVLDRLSPQPTTASAMRWSSVFRISHRLVDRYADGRVFVAGDAAHIHPPTGAQGMNTGIQDAYNLAWKLALTAGGSAHPQLLASYDAERRPIGEEVVGRTVRHATEGIQADPTDPATLMLREAQLLVGYRGSPIVGRPHPDGDGAGPQPGDRAPDCGGLTGEIAAYPLRLYDLLRDRGHVLLLYGNGPPGDGLDELAAAARELSHGQTEPCVVLAEGAPANGTRLPVYRDGRGEFARAYGAQDPTGFVVRPDGYLGTRLCPPTTQELAAHLACVFRS
ncbi:FAD-dependent monooxygenase [Streptomyces lunaelactis]|uniref:FAD-dependent monooxygenase n=1 Tax=Streptomyces lunaelactis TaxID=1535768 RepID=UPI0015856FA8|nr:FAD-dependent monooxygenase [Streptomyces lunaelactis]NUK06448.1 FAD-dependent monooxygenase [Streptomyces lunaelactis]NUL11839.1 FAD-dependent monooxygenase [Streptomyces lunaelactis]NUL23482.1 FAD-dependent monooxygenase [Streptomyces lunaelactis]